MKINEQIQIFSLHRMNKINWKNILEFFHLLRCYIMGIAGIANWYVKFNENINSWVKTHMPKIENILVWLMEKAVTIFSVVGDSRWAYQFCDKEDEEKEDLFRLNSATPDDPTFAKMPCWLYQQCNVWIFELISCWKIYLPCGNGHTDSIFFFFQSSRIRIQKTDTYMMCSLSSR